jgi:hypothetical protein
LDTNVTSGMASSGAKLKSWGSGVDPSAASCTSHCRQMTCGQNLLSWLR